MKIPILSISIFLLLFSCSRREEKPQPAITVKQSKIVKVYKNIGNVSNIHPDSLIIYANEIERLAVGEPQIYRALAHHVRGIYYLNTSQYELSKKALEKALRLSAGAQYDTVRAKTYIGLGNNFKNTGDYPRAFGYLYKALKIYEKHHYKYGIVSSFGTIAQIYVQKDDLGMAEENLKKALNVLGDDKENYFFLVVSHTLANVYGMEGNYNDAFKIDKEGIRISEKLNSPRNKVTFLDNKANCFMYSHQLDSAGYYFNECLKIDVQIGEQKQIGDTYNNLGTLAIFKKDYVTAEKNLTKAISIFKDIHQKPNQLISYTSLVNLYKEQRKFEAALQAQLEKEAITNELISEKKEAALAEFNILYETQKKEQQLAENKVLLLQKEAEAKQKNYFLIASTSLAFFIALVGFLIYRQQKTKNRQQEQEYKLRSAIAQIESQNELQEQRLTISRDLHDNIGAQLTFIISSIENIKYAFDISNDSLHTKLSNISSFARETIVELRDTIWAMNHQEITFEELRSRILNFIEKAKDATEKIEFKFTIADALNDIKLSSIVGVNCYRTVQEAINNAIKYSEAGRIEITVEHVGDSIQIRVQDNGIGFDTYNVEIGNGLRNMQKRIDEIDGILSLHSVNDEGTTITILFKM